METATPAPACPECGAALSPGTAKGLCPRCLMAAAAAPTEAAPPTAAPALARVAAAFPQLEVLEIIGQGGMGAVFRVRQSKLNRPAALKILPESLAADPAFAGRFEREAQLLAKLSHPGIVAVYDYGQAEGLFYLLMEYVDGANLRQAMRAGRCPAPQALGIVRQICEALQFAHDEGVLHRDIKPENILLDERGRVKLVDFGIAKLVAEPDTTAPAATPPAPALLTQAGSALGTPAYMAPEQREHPAAVDHRADIYSLGVVFYELLTGELPAQPVPPPSAKSEVGPRIDAIVRQALQPEPGRRQSSAAEMKTQVESAGHPDQPTPPPVPAADLTNAATPRRAPGKRCRLTGWFCLLLALLIPAGLALRNFTSPTSFQASGGVLIQPTQPDIHRPEFRDSLFGKGTTVRLEAIPGTELVSVRAEAPAAQLAANRANAAIAQLTAKLSNRPGVEVRLIESATVPPRPQPPTPPIAIVLATLAALAAAWCGLVLLLVASLRSKKARAAQTPAGTRPAGNGTIALVLLLLLIAGGLVALPILAVTAFVFYFKVTPEPKLMAEPRMQLKRIAQGEPLREGSTAPREDHAGPIVRLSYRLPGQAPEEIDERAASLLGTRLAAIPGVAKVHAVSGAGNLDLYVLTKNGTNRDQLSAACRRVAVEVNRELPANAEWSALVAVDSLPPPATDPQTPVARVRVDIDRDKAAMLGLPAAAVADAVARIKGSQPESPELLRKLESATVDADGRSVRLAEVATITLEQGARQVERTFEAPPRAEAGP